MSIPLPIESYDKTPSSTSRLLNCYIEQLPQGSKGPALLTRTDGVQTWATVGTGPIYGMLDALDSLFVVSGTKLYEVDSSANATELGSVGPIASIDMDANTDAVVVVNEPDAFYWNGPVLQTFGQITDADFTALGAGDVEFVNNFMLFRAPGTGVFFGADLGSHTSFDALNFATAEANPDQLVGMKVDHVQPIMFGKKSVEIWDNVPISGFPFQRATNGYVEIGCFNGKSIAKCDNSVMWGANDYTVRRLDGVTPVRISQHGIEKIIQRATISTANAFSYSRGGHLFYVLSHNESTVVYDATAKTWHERQSYGYNNWIAGSHASAYGMELVGSTVNGQIGFLSEDVFTEFGNTLVMSWTYQPIYNAAKRAFHDRLEITMDVGVGLTTGQGSDPEIMLEYSDDSGKTWLSLPNKKLGPIGNYRVPVVWTCLGSTDSARVYRASVSDPVRVSVVDTQVTVRGGRV